MSAYFKYRIYKDTQVPGIFITTTSKDLDFTNLEEGNYILEIRTIDKDGNESNTITDYFTFRNKRDAFVIKNVYGQLIKFYFLDNKFQILSPKDIIIFNGKNKYFGENVKSEELVDVSTLSNFFILSSGEKVFFDLTSNEYGAAIITGIAFEGDKKGFIEYKKIDSNSDFKQLVEGDIISLLNEYEWKVNYILKKSR